MPSRSIIRTGVGPHREPGNPFPAMAAAINVLAARVARVQSRRNLSRSLSPKLDHSHSITRFDRSRTGPKDPQNTPNTIDVMAPSLEAAKPTAEKLQALPEVSRTVTLATFIPADQDEKLALIRDAAMLLD